MDLSAFTYLILATRNPSPMWMDSDRGFMDRSEALEWAAEKIRDGYAYVSITVRETLAGEETTLVLHNTTGEKSRFASIA